MFLSELDNSKFSEQGNDEEDMVENPVENAIDSAQVKTLKRNQYEGEDERQTQCS